VGVFLLHEGQVIFLPFPLLILGLGRRGDTVNEGVSEEALPFTSGIFSPHASQKNEFAVF
jgi:hypothetical protein